MSSEEGDAEAEPVTQRYCGNCGKTGHNVRTCQKVEETSDEDNYIVSNWINYVIVEQLS